MNIGDKVEKVGGDYTFVGLVVAVFNKAPFVEKPGGSTFRWLEPQGPVRFVVQDDRGVLHIYSEKNLRILP